MAALGDSDGKLTVACVLLLVSLPLSAPETLNTRIHRGKKSQIWRPNSISRLFLWESSEPGERWVLCSQKARGRKDHDKAKPPGPESREAQDGQCQRSRALGM